MLSTPACDPQAGKSFTEPVPFKGNCSVRQKDRRNTDGTRFPDRVKYGGLNLSVSETP